MTPEKLREWLVGIEKDFAWSIGKRDMEALAQLRAMLAQGKPSPCGDVRDCAECINLADCCPMADARGPGQVVGTDSVTQPGICFCDACGTPLGVKDDAQGKRGPGLGLNQVIGDDGELYTLGISGGPWEPGDEERKEMLAWLDDFAWEPGEERFRDKIRALLMKAGGPNDQAG